MYDLNKKEAEAIAKLTTEAFEDCLSKYDSSKYPEEPYLEWRNVFANPKDVTSEHIQAALEWKYGHWGKGNYVPAHKIIIAKLQKYWPEFAAAGNVTLDFTFSFFEEKLAGHQNFITIAFLSHLLQPDEIEIIDQHNFRAMNYFLSQVSPEWLWRRIPASIEDIQCFSRFFKTVQSTMKLKDDRKRDLDKFLMMFGKHKVRDAYIKKVKAAPAVSKNFNWDSFESTLFDVSKVVNRTNADVLFGYFINSLETDGQALDLKKTMTIEDIQKRIPQHVTGITQSASYNYALISLLAGQKGRDYFMFQDKSLKQFFVEQANKSTRDNSCWKKHLDELVRINPLYFYLT